jgi:phenylacetate-CoA ligase
VASPDLLHGPREALLSHQLTALDRLLDAIQSGNLFYRHKLAGTAVAAGGRVDSLDAFAVNIPFTTKTEIVADQLAHPPFGTNLTFPLDQYTRAHQTSGTTGTPIRWLDTPESWDQLVECWAEVLRAAGVTVADRVFFAFSFGPFIGFWLAFEAAERLGALCIPGGGLTSAARLRSILDYGATVLCCTPTYALHLAEVAALEQIALSAHRVRTIVVAGEPGGSIPATRHRIEQGWPGARVFDHHGMTEVGPVTFECPRTPGTLHVVEWAFLAEVIDPTTSLPVGDGQRGELILTTLHRTCSPLLRYRTGDLVEPVFPPQTADAPACACGRTALALRGGILGRADDMVIVRGVNVFPGAVEEVIRRFPDVVEYQVTVAQIEGMTELTIRLEPGPHCADLGGLVKRLSQAFQIAFALRVPIIPVPPGTLPRFELKAKRWVRAA